MSIEFNPSLLRIDYHEVVRISPQGYALVLEGGHGRKVRISKSVYTTYRQRYMVIRFSRTEPKRMAFLCYGEQNGDEVVIDIEAAPTRGGMTNDEFKAKFNLENAVLSNLDEKWKATMEQGMRLMFERANFGNPLVVWYFDGQYLYPIRKSLVDANPIDSTGRFFMERTQAINLAALRKDRSLAVGSDSKKEKALSSMSADRLCFVYRFKETKHWDNFAVSPSFGLDTTFKGIELERILAHDHALDIIQNHFRVNVDFIIMAADTVRQMYGNENNHAIDFLNLPKILLALRVSTLASLPKATRQLTPVQHDIKTIMAWLLGLIKNDKSLAGQFMLLRLFRRFLSKGLVSMEDKQRLARDEETMDTDPSFQVKKEVPMLDVAAFRAKRGAAFFEV